MYIYNIKKQKTYHKRVGVNSHAIIERLLVKRGKHELLIIYISLDNGHRISFGHFALDSERLAFLNSHFLLVVEFHRIASEIQQHVL